MPKCELDGMTCRPQTFLLVMPNFLSESALKQCGVLTQENHDMAAFLHLLSMETCIEGAS